MKLLPYTSFFWGILSCTSGSILQSFFLVGMRQLNDLTGLKSLEFVFVGDFWTDSTTVNHPFLQPPFGNYDLFCSKKHHGLLQIKDRGAGIFLPKVAPYAPSIGFQRPEGWKKQIRPQQKLPQKTWNFSRCLEVQWIFLLQSPGSEFTMFNGRTRTQKNKHAVDGSEIRRENPVDMENPQLFAGFYTSQVVIAGFLASTKQWEKLSTKPFRMAYKFPPVDS